MDEKNGLSGKDLEKLLYQAKAESAYASIRAMGSARILGDLQVRGLEPGKAIQLMGVKRREQFPVPGSEVILSILLGDEVISSHTTLLEPIVFAEGDTMFPPVLRLAWPTKAIQTHRRHEVRVAGPDFPSLDATIEVQGKHLQAQLLNLTETGMGLGLVEKVDVPFKTQVQVETLLPGGAIIRAPGEIRHAEFVENEPQPMRLGIVLGAMTDQVRDALHRFIQARRMDRSEEMRKSH
jgi:hypothetical protein